MKSKLFIVLLISMGVGTSGCQNFLPSPTPTPAPVSTPSPTSTASIAPSITPESNLTGMTESEAKAIAEATCIKAGESLAPGYYNENSKTWWFDATLNEPKEGCNPACVVSEDTKTVEINWRCTGFIPPTDSPSAALKEIFAVKYPQYEATLSVRVNDETENHVRGSYSMEPGAPGGIFLAVKNQGMWSIVHEGNGGIPCSLSQYGFPENMLSDCAE